MSDAPRTAKEAVYDERISPLMAQIIALCKEHKINMCAEFSLGPDPDGHDLWCTTLLHDVDPTDEEGVERMRQLGAIVRPRPTFFAITITGGKETPR